MPTTRVLRRPRPSSLAAINVTPLVDVLLILLVVVMLAMPVFVKRAPVQLPQTSINGVPVAVASVRVYVGDKGELFLDQRLIDRASLMAKIQPGVSVELGASAATSYARLMELMGAIQERGPREVTLLTY